MSSHPTETFQAEKTRLEEEIREGMQEAITNIHILNRNVEHLNEIGYEVANVSNAWVEFLQKLAMDSPAPRPSS